jgi:hypothetical protein
MHRLALTNHKVELLMTLSTPTRGVPNGILAEYGGDAEDVPHSVPPIALMPYFSYIVCWKA